VGLLQGLLHSVLGQKNGALMPCVRTSGGGL
jgi:hypothetical protein